MTLLDMNLDDVPELEILPAADYQLKIEKVDIVEYSSDKGSGKRMAITFSVEDEPNTGMIFHSLFLPSDDDDEQKANSKKRRIIAFFNAFGVDPSGSIELEELVGETGWALLKIQPPRDQYEECNVVAKFITSN